MTAGLAALGILIGLPGALGAVHLTTLTIASLAYREPPAHALTPHQRFLVVIPAHNEQDVISRTLSSIEHARRAGDRILVVADRCTDETASIARAFGAMVLERGPDARPGRAATRQDGVDAARGVPDWDAMVMIDADSLVEPDFFIVCERMLGLGALALQVRSEAAPGRGVLAQAAIAASALQGITIPRGRDRLGLSVRLKGSGLVVTRELIERHRFRGPGASEDLWLSLDLCCVGVLPRHVDSTRLRFESARSVRAASGQRLRWEAGRLMAAREFVGPLLVRHDGAALEAAFHLLTPPLAMAMLSLAASAALLLAARWLPAAGVAGMLLLLVAADVVVGLVAARARLATWCALLTAPAYIAWKAWLQAGATLRVLRPERSFPPTSRD